jgi:hypothetical protein
MADLASTMKVGGEIDAWCGPCDLLTNHHIVAMVSQEPKQVVCQICGSRHGYRISSARRSTNTLQSESGTASHSNENARKAEQKAEEMRALSRELATAETVRTFDPRERYRAGEILTHPEFGRGKVENVLRSSILVRFATSGLKSLMLN